MSLDFSMGEWRNMETAPLDSETWIWVLTTHNRVEHARCLPEKGVDRWGRDNVRFNCVAWQPMVKPEAPSSIY